MIHTCRAVVLGLVLLAVTSATSDHTDNNSSLTQRSLQDSGDNDPRLRLSISEAYPCIPPDEVRLIHQDPTDTRLPWENGDSGAVQNACYLQQNYCGSSSAPSACCRVSYEAGWLVCDAYNAFDFMPCVCNDNTYGSSTSSVTATSPPRPGPTGQPTSRPPTRVPTESPTRPPTPTPTLDPTAALVPTGDAIVAPVAAPTPEPTDAPVADPTFPPVPAFRPFADPTSAPDPTEAPVVVTESPTRFPTRAPTTSPTEFPTKSPTGFPTKAPVDDSLSGFTTENKFDTDLDATIRQSQCLMDPPAIQFVQGSTFAYQYEVNRLETPSETQAEFRAEALGDGIAELSEDWTQILHDELAEKFLVCDGYDSDTVWILQSKTHEVDASVPCTGSSNNDDENLGESPNDAGSNDSASTCVTVKAEVRIIAYSSPIGEKAVKQLWSTTSYGEGAVADEFSRIAVAYLEDRLNGDGDALLAPSFGTVFVGGGIVDTSGETTESDGDNNNDSGNSGTDNNGTEGNAGEGDGNGDGANQDTPETEDGTNLWSDTTGGTAIGVESSNINSTSPAKSWLTPGAITTIAVVASCLVILLLLAALRRNKQGPQEDEEYLQDVGSPKSDYYNSGRPVGHLDLSVSSDSAEDVGPIIRSDLDLEGDSGGKSNHRGLLAKSPVVSKALSSPKHFHFSGFTSTTPSPRERSKMGPLNMADEFRESSSGRTSQDETTTGTTSKHRGIVTNSSSSSNHRGIVTNSSSSSNHRGIVTTSSSMSSNLPAPHQNTSPRLYQLRDTVKL